MKIYHIDTCLPDYFGGHHLPNFNIPVYKGMTYYDLKQQMLSGYFTDHIEELNGKEEEEFIREVEYLFNGVDLESVLPEVEDREEEMEVMEDYINDVCMFFVIEGLGGE